MGSHNRIEVIHGVNLDTLGRRDPAHYGTLTLTELETRIAAYGTELDLALRFFQTNHEGALIEHLHRLDGIADGILINPGAWAHYSYALADAVEVAALPTIEVHLSDTANREPWRRTSVLQPLVVARVGGMGLEGYREALVRLKAELAG